MSKAALIAGEGTTLREPPGPPGLPLVGLVPYMRRDPLRCLSEVASRYGDVATLRLGLGKAYLLSAPEHVQRVLLESPEQIPRGALYDRLVPALGRGLITSEGALWRKHRRMLQPIFNPKLIDSFLPIMVEATERLLDTWEDRAASGAAFDLVGDMMEVTLDIIFRTLFSEDPAGSSLIADFNLMNQVVGDRYWDLTPAGKYLPTPRNVRFLQARAEVDRTLYRLIERRRATLAGAGAEAGRRKDLLTLLLEAKDSETGTTLTDRNIRDELITFASAGHETTALTLVWTFLLLSEHPDVQARLVHEAPALTPTQLSMASVQEQLPATRQAIEESMRVYAPLWLLSRTLKDGGEFGGYTLPPGALILISPYILHRHPQLWDQPERFLPERFAKENAAGRKRFSYIPFGAGPHHCIGYQLALIEAQLIIGLVHRRFRLVRADAAPIGTDPKVTLRPRGSVMMRLQRVAKEGGAR